MTEPIASPAERAVVLRDPGAARTTQPTRGEGFATVLRRSADPVAATRAAGSSIVELSARAVLVDAARSIGHGQRMVDSIIRAARRGHVFTQGELIAAQAGVYRYAQELELASKLVDKATSAVRQTLQSQR